jgi:diketogulonate reductase-like aldo/keto reductase
VTQPATPLWQAAIPSSGERIPRIGLGTWQTFDVGTDPARRTDLAEVLRVFSAGGGTVVDTSPMYGSSETVLGDLIQQAGLRAKLFLATKVWTTGEPAGIVQMESSATKLKSPALDLIQIHNLLDWRVHLRTLRAWQERGRIRYLGITHYQASAIDQVADIVRAEPLDFVQLNLSLDEPAAGNRLLGLCAERGVAFIANRPFGGGGSFGRARGKPLPPWAADYDIQSWAQFLLKWVLAHPEVTCAIPGTGNPRHLADNLGGARGRLPDVATRSRMAAAWRAL